MAVKPESKASPETYYVGAYWGPRKESPEECARRTAAFLNLLAECDPLLAHWYKPTRSLKDARKYPLMPPDVPTLTEQFRRGVNRERGGPVFEDLGFRFWFGNGGTGEDRASLRIKCGCYAEGFFNSCVLPLPDKGPNAERMLSVPVLASVLRSMALAWTPDWAVAMSDTYQDMVDKSGKADVLLGWMTYLARHLGKVPPLPAAVRIEPIEDKGTLLVLTPERFTASNPEHVELARHVRELLVRAGLMRAPR